jgi:hypothetical protein
VKIIGHTGKGDDVKAESELSVLYEFFNAVPDTHRYRYRNEAF